MAWYLNDKEVGIIKQLLLQARAFESYEEAFEVIIKSAKRPFVVSFLNMFAIQTALKNEEFYNVIMRSDILFIDGIGGKLLCKRFNIPYGINMNGTDYIPWLFDKFKAGSFLVFGSTQETVTKFKEKLSGYNILQVMDGFKDYDTYITAAKQNPADVILLGMGMPKQELLSTKIQTPAIIINGGAIVDYVAGTKVRAPQILIMLKVEWVYRMFYEPKRLFKRYIDGIGLMGQIYLTKTK